MSCCAHIHTNVHTHNITSIRPFTQQVGDFRTMLCLYLWYVYYHLHHRPFVSLFFFDYFSIQQHHLELNTNRSSITALETSTEKGRGALNLCVYISHLGCVCRKHCPDFVSIIHYKATNFASPDSHQLCLQADLP